MKISSIRHRLLQALYVLVDAFAAELVWFVFLYFRWLVLDQRVTSWESFLAPGFTFSVSSHYPPFLWYPLGCLLVYYFLGYYLRPGKKKLISVIESTFYAALIIACGAFVFIILDDVDIVNVMRYYKSVGVLALFQFVLVLFPRLLLYHTIQRRFRRERVVVHMKDGMTEQEVYSEINALFSTGKEIAIEPRLFDVFSGAAQITHMDESPLIVVSEPKMSDWELVTKRTFDLFASLVAIILLSPLMGVLAFLVRLSSPGPIIYKQKRIGFQGKEFNILKFRSMYMNAESETPLLSKVGDSRITPLGRIMRKYRLDELPQLWNILRGEMSIVGPRPERLYFVQKIMQKAPYYCLLYKVRPGLTSWGPVKVGYTDTMEKMIQRLQYDIAYTENMSIALDIKIMLRTIGVLIDGKGQ